MNEPVSLRSVVVGACGFVGSHLCEVLAQAGHTLLAFDDANRVAEGLVDSFPEVVRGLGTSPESWPLEWRGALSGASFLFVVEGPQVQVEAALAAAGSVQRVVLISAAEVYGEPQSEPFSEEAAPAPQGGRARELLDLERAVRASELPHVILRPTGVYGPRGARGLWEARRRVGVTGPSSAQRVGLVHARDLARAALHVAARADLAPATTYNVGDDAGLRAAEAARLVSRIAGRPHLSLRWPALPRRWLRFARPRKSLAIGAPRVSSARLAETGFALEYPHPGPGLRETLAWYKQECWL